LFISPYTDRISYFELLFHCFFLTLCSCVLFDSYVLLADDHVNNVSYFPLISNKSVLREGYYVIM
jgi:hypothetical protein